MRRAAVTLGAGLLVVLPVVGCGDDAAEKAAEKIAEKVAESGSGGDVDVDIDKDGGKVKIKTDEGEFTAQQGGELPDWVSDDIPIPGQAKVTTAFDSEKGRSVQLSANGEPKAVFEKFKSDLADKGIDLIGEPTSFESGGVAMYMLQFADKNGKVIVTFSAGDGDTLITITLADSPPGE